MHKGIGKTGGIGRLPIVIPTVVDHAEQEQAPPRFWREVASVLAGPVTARDIVKTAEGHPPPPEDFPSESIPKYAVMYREARLEIAKQGIYNKTTLT